MGSDGRTRQKSEKFKILNTVISRLALDGHENVIDTKESGFRNKQTL